MLAIHKKPDAAHTYDWVLKGFSMVMCAAVLLLSAIAQPLILLLASERVRTPSYSAYGQPYYWGTGVVVAPPVVAPSTPLPDAMRRPIVATPAPPTTPPSNHGRFLAPAVPSTARAAAISRR